MSDGVGNCNAHRMDRRFMYIDEIPDDLICPICSDVFDKPIQCSNGHVFCRKCLDDWANKWRGDNADDYGGYPNASDAPCPNCRIAIGRPIPILLVDGVLNTFAVKCKHACFSTSSPRNEADDSSQIQSVGLKRTQSEFCSWTGKKRDLERHLRDECEFCCGTCSDCGTTSRRRKTGSTVDHDCKSLSWLTVKLPVHLEFHSVIGKVLLQVHPGLDISLNAIILIEDLLAEVLMRLLMQRASSIVEAVKLVFASSMARCAVTAHLTKAHLHYGNNAEGDEPTEVFLRREDCYGDDDDAFSSIAKLVFSVRKVALLVMNYTRADMITVGESIMHAATIECITAEILELAGNNVNHSASANGANCRICPCNIMQAIRNDFDLNDLFRGAFSFCGVDPLAYAVRPMIGLADEPDTVYVCQTEEYLNGLPNDPTIRRLKQAFVRLCAKAGIVKVKTSVLDDLQKISDTFLESALLHYRRGGDVPHLIDSQIVLNPSSIISHTSSLYGEGLMMGVLKYNGDDDHDYHDTRMISHDITDFAVPAVATDPAGDVEVSNNSSSSASAYAASAPSSSTSSSSSSSSASASSSSSSSNTNLYEKSLKMIHEEKRCCKPLLSKPAFEECVCDIAMRLGIALTGHRCQVVYAIWEASMVDLLGAASIFKAHASRDILYICDVRAALFTRS